MPDLPGIRVGVVRGISYGLFGRPDEWIGPARALGARLVRAYLYWSQIEPEPGRFVWDPVDALLDQCDDDVELWLTICSSSPWATRAQTDFLPPSPAVDQSTYGAFVRALVDRCAGRVRYWQCDNEPTNTGLLFAGSPDEYVTQLSTMYAAVKQSDPAALVVLGGCGFDVLGSEPGSATRSAFEHIVTTGRDWFDVIAVNLYGDPAAIPGQLAYVRALPGAQGRPIVIGESGGPVPFEFPDAAHAMQALFAQAFAEAPPNQSLAELQAAAGRTPEYRAMSDLYDRMPTLPPRLQMFLEGCPPELEQLRHRINCRQLVMRTMLALAEGVNRLSYWNLAHEVPRYVDPRQMMALMFGKLPLLEYDGQARLSIRRPAADTFARLAGALDGARSVTRRPDKDQRLRLFDVERPGRGPSLVAWREGDPVDGEAEPPTVVDLAWPASTASLVDVFGATGPGDIHSGQIRLPVGLTPVFVNG